MDLFSQTLSLLRAHSYTTTGLSGNNHWAMHYPGFDGFKFICVTKGKFWFRLPEQTNWREMQTGDGVIITRKQSFLIASDPNIPPQTPDMAPYELNDGLANYGGQDNILLAGKMTLAPHLGSFLLHLLPATINIVTHTESASTLGWLMRQLHREHSANSPGVAIASDHLMQLIMLEGIRSWFDSVDAAQQQQLQLLLSPSMFQVLSAIHEAPQKNWSLAELSEIAHLSRSTFVRKFQKLTQQTPQRYITQWKMTLASKALSYSDEPVKQLAFRLGFEAESSFSTAFKRLYGQSPSDYRAQQQLASNQLKPFNVTH